MITRSDRGMPCGPALLLCAFSPALAQAPTAKLSPADLKADLAVVRRTLEQAHAGFYPYTPKEEMDAAYQGTTAGIVPTVTLPHSGIRLNVPLIAYENAVLPGLYPGHGAPPHFVVGETLQDALQGRDTVLEFTLALIAKRTGG